MSLNLSQPSFQLSYLFLFYFFKNLPAPFPCFGKQAISSTSSNFELYQQTTLRNQNRFIFTFHYQNNAKEVQVHAFHSEVSCSITGSPNCNLSHRNGIAFKEPFLPPAHQLPELCYPFTKKNALLKKPLQPRVPRKERQASREYCNNAFVILSRENPALISDKNRLLRDYGSTMRSAIPVAFVYQRRNLWYPSSLSSFYVERISSKTRW